MPALSACTATELYHLYEQLSTLRQKIIFKDNKCLKSGKLNAKGLPNGHEMHNCHDTLAKFSIARKRHDELEK